MSKKKVLSQIVKENDIHNIAPADYRQLAKEIRAKLVRSVSRTGGHLASNLGAVELTMALHLCLHFPEDKLIWDVGHQSYVHKILTGRGDAFSTLRQMGGLSGFPKVKEIRVIRLIPDTVRLRFPWRRALLRQGICVAAMKRW